MQKIIHNYSVLIKKKVWTEKEVIYAKKILDYCSQIYYNTEEQSPLTDQEFDMLLKEYRKYNTYIDGTKPSFNKKTVNVEHDFPELVGTLYKTNTLEELKEWISKRIKNKCSFAVSQKKDGNSVTITYNNKGVPLSALTRGKDGEGADLLYLFKDRKIKSSILDKSNTNQEIGIKYEAIIDDASFEEINKIRIESGKKSAVNPRSLVAGILSSSDGEVYAKYITLVPLRIIEKGVYRSRADEIELIYEYENLNKISTELSANFSIFSNVNLTTAMNLIGDLYKTLSYERTNLNHMIDGLVIEFVDDEDRNRLGRNGFQNEYDVALKFPYLTNRSKVKNIEFYVGKTGRITPVVVFEPIKFNGATCDHVSIANYKRFKELSLAIGDEIIIEYRNDVLAYLQKGNSKENTQTPIKFITKCPTCKKSLFLNKTRTFVHCRNINCKSIQVGRILKWIEVLNIKGINSATIEKLFDASLLKSISSLYTITKEDIMKIDGFQERSAENFIQNIHDKTPIFDWELLAGLGIQDIGRHTTKEICKLYNLDEALNLSYDELIKIDSIADISAITYIEGIKENMELINEIKKLVKIKTYKDTIAKSVSGSLSIVFTGIRDLDLQTKLENKGHKVTSGVSRKTNYVVVSDINFVSEKTKKAKEYGIPMYDLNTFKKDILDNI